MKLSKRSQRQLDEAFAADSRGTAHLKADEQEADGSAAEVTLRLDSKLADKLDRRAKKKGLSREATAAKILKKRL